MAVSAKRHQKFDNQALKTAAADTRTKPPSAEANQNRARRARNKVRSLATQGYRLNNAKASNTYLTTVRNQSPVFQERQDAQGQLNLNAGKTARRKATGQRQNMAAQPLPNKTRRQRARSRRTRRG